MTIPGVPKTTNRDRSRLWRVFDPEIVIKCGCEYLGYAIDELKTKSRKRIVVFPRQVIIYFLTEYTDWTYFQIGDLFDKDHTTVIHSKDTIIDLITTDDSVRDKVEELKRKIIDSHV